MKIRKDFVTNSSSSSFIIGKSGDKSVNRDTVFNLMKELYKEYLSRRDEFKKIMDKFSIMYKEDKNGWGKFEFKEGNKYNQKQDEIRKLIEKNYHLSLYDIYDWNCNWLKCKNYAEYEEFWVKMITIYKGSHAPFSIHDYSGRKESIKIEGGAWSLEQGNKRVNKNLDLLDWYSPCASDYVRSKNKKEFLNNGEFDCSWCHNIRGDKKCQQVLSYLEKGGITENNAIAMVLGRVCIHSECGYIPDSIVDKLIEISEYCCNHMG